MTPTLLMLIGIPGSGKSSWLNSQKKGNLRTLIDNEPFWIVCPDALRKKRFDNVSDQSQNTAVWQEAKDLTTGFLQHGTAIILDATNVNTKYRRDFISELPPCKLLAKVFPVTPETAWERVMDDLLAGRDRATVPEETIYRMYGEFLYTMKVLPSEGFEFLEDTKCDCNPWAHYPYVCTGTL
jgi:Predicted kinase